MDLKINTYKPSFGVVTQKAINLAISHGEQGIDKLVVSQEENKRYNVTTTVTNPKTAKRSFCVSKYPGRVIKIFPSLVAACLFASASENADKN